MARRPVKDNENQYEGPHGRNTWRGRPENLGRPAFNEEGVPHIYATGPEAGELKARLSADWGKNADHAKNKVFNPDGDDSPGMAARQREYATALRSKAELDIPETRQAVSDASYGLQRQRDYAAGKQVRARGEK